MDSLKAFPGGSVIKTPPGNAGDKGSIPGSGRSPGKGNGNLPVAVYFTHGSIHISIPIS